MFWNVVEFHSDLRWQPVTSKSRSQRSFEDGLLPRTLCGLKSSEPVPLHSTYTCCWLLLASWRVFPLQCLCFFPDSSWELVIHEANLRQCLSHIEPFAAFFLSGRYAGTWKCDDKHEVKMDHCKWWCNFNIYYTTRQRIIAANEKDPQ